MSDETTPYAVAVALHQQGASRERIVLALKDKGLDDEGIALLLSALGTRGAEAPPPQAEWTPAPAEATSSVTEKPPAPVPAAQTPCPRCGVFMTPLDGELVLGTLYCRTCAARPDVNYPRAFRDAHWGKRDGYAWLFGCFGLLSLLFGGILLMNQPLLGGSLLVSGVAGVIFWSGLPVGRPVLVAGAVLGAGLNLAMMQPPNILNIFLVIGAMQSARNKLFFKLEVPEPELVKAWRLVHDNQVARWAVATAAMVALSMLAWVSSRNAVWVTLALSGLPIGLGVVGLTRVDPKAMPPIGRRGQAITGIVLGAISALAAAAVLASGWRGA